MATQPQPHAVPDPERKPMRKTPKKRFFILLALLLAVAAGATATWAHFQNRVSTDDATVDGHISSVSPKISGNVTDVLVNDNQQVKAGQVLVKIDPRDFQAKVDMARAALQQAQSQAQAAQLQVPFTNEATQSQTSAAEAQLADAEAEQTRSRLAYEQASSADLAFAESNVRTQQANNDRAQADLARMKPLVDKEEISKQQYDSYVAAARMAESQLQAARDKLASSQKEASMRQAAVAAAESKVKQANAQVQNSLANRKQVPIKSADVGTASAIVQSARASLEAAELQLSYTTIVAPIDGVVTRKSVEVGQVVSPGQGMMAIIPLKNTWVTANFKETQLKDVRPGQRAEIHVDMYGKSIEGRVDSIAGATGSKMSLLPPENATGNFVKVVQRIPVKILVDQRESIVLRPGMNVDATIFTK